MSIMDMVNEQKSNISSIRGGTGASDQPKAKVWLNVGYTVEVDGEEVRITLPLGIALDTMKAITVTGQSVEWHKLAGARNALLKALQDAGDEVEPGSEVTVPDLTVSIRHVAAEMVVDQTDNAFIAAMPKFGKAV